jgi:hypothetical protein
MLKCWNIFLRELEESGKARPFPVESRILEGMQRDLRASQGIQARRLFRRWQKLDDQSVKVQRLDLFPDAFVKKTPKI